MINKVVIITILFQINLSAESMYFMPYESKQAINALVKEIKNAKKEVKIAIYSFTNREISKAIRDTAKRGVNFKIVYDYSNAIKDESTIGYLAKLKNVDVCMLQGKLSENGKYHGIMHNKLAIIDDETVILGSANWSKSAFSNNYELLIISKNKEYIVKSRDYITKMINECTKY